jgi:hypothetical protein
MLAPYSRDEGEEPPPKPRRLAVIRQCLADAWFLVVFCGLGLFAAFADPDDWRD